jgi:hypothetical protein
MSSEFRLLRIDRRRFELRGSDASVAATIDFVGRNRAMIETGEENFSLVRSGFLTPLLILRDDAANGRLIARGSCSGAYRMLDGGLSWKALSFWHGSYGWTSASGSSLVRYVPVSPWKSGDAVVTVEQEISDELRVLAIGAFLLKLTRDDDSAVLAITAAAAATSMV